MLSISSSRTTAALAGCAVVLLSACGTSPTPAADSSAPQPDASSSPTATSAATSAQAPVVESTTAPTTSAAAATSGEKSSSATSAQEAQASDSREEFATLSSAPGAESTTEPAPEHPRFAPSVEETYERFHTLAPASLFAQFDSCRPNGVPKSAACAGEVGQFQFFASDAKAASTTQLLTELRSSRVVEDDGSRVVGWSTLGTTAIVTVVDNKRGLVMQHMMSSEKSDPAEVIAQLQLAQPTEGN